MCGRLLFVSGSPAMLARQFVIQNIRGCRRQCRRQRKSDPDGYTDDMTLLAVINNALYADPGYDAVKDFVPLAAWAQS